MDMTRIALVLAVASCTPAATSLAVANLSQLPACSTATTDDGLDDTAAVQLAINTRCCLGPGVHDIDMTPTPPVGRRRYDMLTVGPTGELCGVGVTTILRFRGDAGPPQDWRGVEMTGGSVHDLRIETGALTGTVEQTHAIHVTGPANGIRIHDVTLDHPIRGALPGGDAIDLVGYPDKLITDTVIRDVIFEHCDRACIQSHGGTVGLTVNRNTFRDTGDVDFNTEGAGGSSDFDVTGNTFEASANNQGAYAVAFDLIDGVTFAGNVLHRGVYLYSCTHCVIARNLILASSGHSTNGGTIEATKASNDLTIADNTITRVAGSDVGPVIHVGPHGTQPSLAVRIVHNTIEQQTTTDVIYTEGVTDLRIDDNAIGYTPTTGIASGARTMGSGTDVTTLVSYVGNTFTGALRSAIYTAGATNRAHVGSLTAERNTASVQGLLCENLFGIDGPLTLVYNSWPTGSCGVPSKAVTVP